MPNPELSQLIYGNATYDLKDAKARQLIEDLGNVAKYLGVTTTQLTDGASTNPITINGDPVTAESGDIALYGSNEFIFDGTHWNSFGDLSLLGTLAYQNSASGNFTPAGSVTSSFSGSEGNVSVSGTPSGSVSGTGVTLTTTSITPFGSAGTLPSCTMPTFTVSGETLTITDGSYSQGVLPSAGTAVTVATGVDAITDPTFTGSATTSTGTFTPSGSVSSSFSGSSGAVTVS